MNRCLECDRGVPGELVYCGECFPKISAFAEDIIGLEPSERFQFINQRMKAGQFVPRDFLEWQARLAKLRRRE